MPGILCDAVSSRVPYTFSSVLQLIHSPQPCATRQWLFLATVLAHSAAAVVGNEVRSEQQEQGRGNNQVRGQADGGKKKIQKIDGGAGPIRCGGMGVGREEEFRVNGNVNLPGNTMDRTRLVNRLPSPHQKQCSRCMWIAMSMSWTKDRSLDVREGILEGDMDLGTTQPSLVLLELMCWRSLGRVNLQGLNKRGWGRTDRRVLGIRARV